VRRCWTLVSHASSPAWMAPEVYRSPSRLPEPSSDMFSFGRLLYFALAGTMPFSHTPMRQVRHMLKTALLPRLTLPGRHAVEEHLADLLDSCLKVNALQRPSMQTVQNALVEAGLKFPDLAHCVTVVRLPVAANFAQQSPQDIVRQNNAAATRPLHAVAGNTKCHEQQQQQQQQQQQCCTSGLEPVCDRLVRQGLLPTLAASMSASMLMTVQRWNYPLPRVSCCPFHASLKTIRDTAEVLTRMECHHDFFRQAQGSATSADSCLTLMLLAVTYAVARVQAA